MADNNRYIVQVFVGALSQHYEALSVEASKQTTSEEIVGCIVDRLCLTNPTDYELAEVIGNSVGQECKERRVGPLESPVALMLLWPKTCASECKDGVEHQEYRFYLREKLTDSLWTDSFTMDPQLIKDYFYRYLYQPKDKEYPDLCQLPDLNEQTLLDNLRARFSTGYIYTYVGSILIAVNPFKFYPMYNPKYVKLYQNRRLGELPPHIFAIADAAYHSMLKEKCNQCIVISGESGSGKTESTNFLLHHLTALSQKGSHGSGVEQTILSAGPVLEAFGNAKTAHNNNSSRFGKFIQVNYKENGMVHGAVVQKYLLEKSRICSQGRNERNYHVFYYLLAGSSETEKKNLHLMKADDYNYLNQSGCCSLEGVDEGYEFSRLKQSMEMVGFTHEKQRRLFAVLSAVLLIGNVEFQPRKSAYHHDEAVAVKNPEIVLLISELLHVKQETLLAALTAKKARASGETLVINYRLPEAIAARDAIAKCLYGALFDWIVLQVNHALLSKKDSSRDHLGNSIGVLDIFGFEDFDGYNSFEQFCINYANEHLQYYFNQHVFKYEQEEYKKEGIKWTNIDFMDNTGCLQLIEGKPGGLLCILDDQCNFPGATNETLLQKFNSVHKENDFYEIPQKREAAFKVKHYAGKVKYHVAEFREKNLDLMRQDIVGVLKNSSMAFVRELVGADPVAVFRWAIVRAFFRAYFAFVEAGNVHRQERVEGGKSNLVHRGRKQSNENLISFAKQGSYLISGTQKRNLYNDDIVPNEVNGNNHSCIYKQRTNTAQVENTTLEWRDVVASKTLSINGQQDGYRSKQESIQGLECVLCPNEAKVLERANQIVMKNKSFRPRERNRKGLKNLETVKTLAGRTQSYSNSQLKGVGTRKQPQTVTAQFQQSLHSLMDTLNQANPFFIRCIKSNSEKVPNTFDEDIVQRQLRYTGMLETVRIRQAGYNVRLTYDEFIHMYRILLPKGLLSSQNDVRDFLFTLNLNRDNYQLGNTKIFLRESEKVKLDYRLHQQIMASIVIIQKWFRAILERRHFLRLQDAVRRIQSYSRMFLAQRQYMQLRVRHMAATYIQKMWRGYKVRKWYNKLKNGIVQFQAQVRGNVARRKFHTMQDEHHRKNQEKARHQVSRRDVRKDVDTHSAQSTDEAFLSKESSQEELDDRFSVDDHNDSEESSGIQEDSESEPVSSETLQNMHVPVQHIIPSIPHSVPETPETSGLPEVTLRLMGEGIRRDLRIDNMLRNTEQNKLTVRRSKSMRNDTKSYIEESFTDVLPPARRKGSTDSLTSEKSVESMKSNESQSGTHVKSTLHRAKKQFQALLSGSKKVDKIESDIMASDSEPDEILMDSRLDQIYPSTSGLPSSFETRTKPDVVWKKQVEDTNHRKPDIFSTAKPIIRSAKVSRSTQFSHVESKQDHKDAKLDEKPGHGKSRYQVRLEEWGMKHHSEHKLTERDAWRQNKWGSSDAHSMTRNSSENSVMSFGDGRWAHDSGAVPQEIFLRAREARSSDGSESSIYSRESEWSTDDIVCRLPGYVGSKNAPRRQWSPPRDLDSIRRSSDPSKSNPEVDECPKSQSDIEWKGTMFSISGHTFRKVTRFSKADMCAFCNKSMDAFFTQGHKCVDCKVLLHTKCIQNGGAREFACLQSTGGGKPGRRKYRKHSRTPYDLSKPSKFSLTGTSEFTDSTDKIISDARELQLMQDFITRKIYKIESEEGKKPSEVDRVFKQALREFKDNLVSTYSVANKQGAEKLNIKYKDLIANFLHVMETVCNHENTREDFPVTMGVNAFRGFMNEFMNLNRLDEKPKTKRKKEKKRKVEESIAHAGHMFLLTIINIPTACEICSSFFMWPIERSLVCQNCKLTCHKKCYSKVTQECGKEEVKVAGLVGGGKIFGVPLITLVGEEGKIPVVVDRLITTIEMYGLYTEGVYRKSGVSSKVKELKLRLEESIDDVNFENYQVHVLTSVLKCFYRDMPEPLLTFECYEDFLRAASLTDPQDRVATLFAILKKLPVANFNLMERLIFHLARVALQEESNRMNAGALAIVFAPCILRTNKIIPAQDSLNDIGQQTLCIETIIQEQLRKVRCTLADIDTLDTACHTATHRLSSLRSSKIFTTEELLPIEVIEDDNRPKKPSFHPEEEEAILTHHIQEIQKEKALLTSKLPSLTRTTSDDDMLSTDLDGSLDDVASATRLEDMDLDAKLFSLSSSAKKHTETLSHTLPSHLILLPGVLDSGDDEGTLRSPVRRNIKRDSSSDNSVVSSYPPPDVECEEDPIMV